MNLLHLLQERITLALAGLVAEPAPYAAMVKPAQDARFGDYQANCAMSLAKALGKKPRDVAQEIVGRLPKDDLFEQVEIAGPGFINFRFRSEWLALQLQQLARGDRLGVAPLRARTYLIDFSSPNVAKPLHVGHLRSTIIGDSLARLLRFLGHQVVADNHLGDWGLQFGMLLHGYKHFRNEAALAADPVQEMLRLYLHVRGLIDLAERSDEDPREAAQHSADALAQSRQHLAACRQETTRLHEGDPDNVALWQKFMPWCLEEINRIYARLDVKFDATHGESFYNPMLAGVVQDLLARAIAHKSQGAVAIFFDEQGKVTAPADPNEPPPASAAEGKKKAPIPPAVIESSHGAYTYTATDLATIQYRMKEWRPDAILYVVDSRQALHFKNLFASARAWGHERVELEHVSFGSVLGPDGKPLKTREGGAIELGALLDEAIKRGEEAYEETRKNRLERGEEVPELTAGERRQIAEAVGLGAVKYADLGQNRESDYVFNWAKMLATDGNTATYMQYAYVRNRGIFRKGDEDAALYRTQPPAVYLEQPHERALALQLLRFEEALLAAAADYRPHLVTGYLWDLAKTYSGFFDKCPVLKATTPALRQSRLLLCDLTARTIQKGLDLLGIRTIERM